MDQQFNPLQLEIDYFMQKNLQAFFALHSNHAAYLKEKHFTYNKFCSV